MARYVDIYVTLAAISLIGIGVALKDVALSLIVVGAIALSLVLIANLKGKPQ